MKKKLLVLTAAIALTSVNTILHAAGDIHAGKEKSASCSGCHGADGNSESTTFPKLAQQHASYLVNQLLAFKAGKRKDAMMSSMAKALSDDDIADLAAFYAAQKISRNDMPVLPANDDDEDNEDNSPNTAKTVEELIAQGSDLYRNGDLTREVSACIACHGPHGEGNKPAAFPVVHSQHADYLIKTLNDFKSGARAMNPDNMMHMIAKKMTDEEIKAVAYRISVMK
ncbi:MAG: cytochrome c4 [Methylomonas sp.]|nr:MAG: cytochrome c4 [Methylobacter sp.]PPD32451.1 MAG: cytochrome c4 [Methylomonas sp.]